METCSPNREKAVEISALTKIFSMRRRAVTALDKVSFDIADGEIVVLLGPNGAGKTTIVRSLVGLVKPTSGIARICGYDTWRESDQVRSLCGVLPEAARVYTRLTVSEYLEFFGAICGMSDSRIMERKSHLMERFGLTSEHDRRLGSLSKGMRMRTQLARSLLHEPRVLLLDEPTEGLDPVAKEGLSRDILSLAHDGNRVAVVCTHDLQLTERIADKVVLLCAGRVVAYGTPRGLCNDLAPGCEVRIRFACASERCILALRKIDFIERVRNEPPFVIFWCNDPQAAIPVAKEMLRAEGIEALDIAQQPPSLYNVYERALRCSIQ